MKRVALIALAPALAAVLLIATGVYRPGSDTAPSTREEPPTAAPVSVASALPDGALVLGGQAGSLAVGLAVERRGSGTLELQAHVLGPDGTGADGLEVEFKVGTAVVAAEACGMARYCASTQASVPTEVDVRIDESGGPVSARFALPGNWEPADDLVARATRVYGDLRTVVFDERLDSGIGKTLEARWRMAAPDRLAYRITGGPAGVVVGSRRWDRAPGGTWIESPQDPLTLPSPPWTDAIRNASLLGSETLDGRETWVVSFLDQASLPTWFTLWIEKGTDRTLEVQMTTAAHFMRQHYRSFDKPLRIEAPA